MLFLVTLMIASAMLASFGTVQVQRSGISARQYDMAGLVVLIGLGTFAFTLVAMVLLWADVHSVGWCIYGVLLGVASVWLVRSGRMYHMLAMSR